jgi:uncharacterized protein with NAD-binding domain and iron-sulfur cluster
VTNGVAPRSTPAPSIANLNHLATDARVGIQFYLRNDVPIVRGHATYADSAWALTSISHPQFWSDVDLSRYGDGTVRGILSVDLSDRHTPGKNGASTPAFRSMSADEVRSEVWAELKAHLNRPGRVVLDDANLVDWNLEPDLPLAPPSGLAKTLSPEPLRINAADSWRHRPEASTEISNLFLAADYVRTFTDLAGMEGANEAARRATNAILQASGSAEPPCQLWPLQEPAAFAPLRELDKELFDVGGPTPFTTLSSLK